jgi:hypothetical protein
MVKNSSFLRRKAVQFFARILRIFSQFCEFGRPKSEAKRKRTLLDFLRSEAKRIRFAFAFFRNKANSQCEFTALTGHYGLSYVGPYISEYLSLLAYYTDILLSGPVRLFFTTRRMSMYDLEKTPDDMTCQEIVFSRISYAG